MHEFIRDSGLIRGKPLQLADIRAILESLVYDARIEQALDASGVRRPPPMKQALDVSGV